MLLAYKLRLTPHHVWRPEDITLRLVNEIGPDQPWEMAEVPAANSSSFAAAL